MTHKRVLLIGGSLNQTKIAHAVGQHLEGRYDCFYTSAFCDGLLDIARRRGWLEFTILGDRIRQQSEAYIHQHGLQFDYAGRTQDYDLLVTTTDVLFQRKLHGKPAIVIQEGMTDPIDWRFHLVKHLRLPRWLAGTAATGISGRYTYFCVASPGYRDMFIHNGCPPARVVVTGLPNFDHVQDYTQNQFPYHDYVLVATSNARETFKQDDRQAFLRWAIEKAHGRPLIFKLHPNENVERATQEINAIAPQALVFSEGSVEQMIANCTALVTQYSSCVYVGLALGKECYSYFDMNLLKKLTPIQNGGCSGKNISQLCMQVLEQPVPGKVLSPIPSSSLTGI